MNRLLRLSSLALITIWMAARVPVSAAELPTSTPEAEGMSAEKLAKVGEIMNGFIKDKKIAGGIVLVARNGKVVFQETYGLRNLDGKLPVERDTIFRIYSMSKAITSAAALMLVDEGKLDLDAPVSKYLPEFAEMKVVDGETERPAKSPITVKDLFRHTSGITYGNAAGSPTEKLFEATDVLDMQSDLALMSTKLSQIPLEFDPGTKWKYGASIDVLGYLVQKVSGQPLDVFLKERIFEPLGDDRHGLLRAGGEAGAVCGELLFRRQGTADHPRRSRQERLPAQARALLRRRRAGGNGERLHAVPADDREWRRVAGQANSFARVGRTDAHEPVAEGRRLDRLRRREAHGRRLRPGFLGDGRTERQESERPQRRVRLGRRGQHALLGLAPRSADRRDDGTTLAVLTGDGRGAQAGDLWGD